MSKKQIGIYHFLIIGLIFGIVVKLFVLDILQISGNSMEPAINDGDTVYVNKLAYGLVKPGSKDFFIQWASPKKNDVVIYLHDNKIVIKRCVATEREKLDYSVNSEYSMYVGDKKITLTKEQHDALHFTTSVPKGFILALGDNYEQSIDSRNYGFVSVKNIVGRIIGK